ncbi:sigma-70 family RNA polymerase sigma factor [Streptomyces dangxiongensis]|uniref:Sigma-70 family RNA polymerase sigma factor n=1 Tax=Streptomyces dangxiongensis TaxID=1442032 RepID=A0A3G2J8G5_9ACTN|nr:sigma-70 family RNA polymerase sigma factor [Streptomyces dangxiongensis]AYN37735.1 sigma-70 family RNA polymerase sigma factor [Streptomyces dangxiongensis]
MTIEPDPSAGTPETPAHAEEVKQFLEVNLAPLLKHLCHEAKEAGLPQQAGEDAVQDALEEAYLSLCAKWTEIQHPKAYLRKVAERKLGEACKQYRRDAPADLTGLDAAATPHRLPLHARHTDLERVVFVRLMVDDMLSGHPRRRPTQGTGGKESNDLTKNQGHAFYMTWVRGDTQHEIGEHLGIKEGTVGAHVDRAKKKLVRKWSGYRRAGQGLPAPQPFDGLAALLPVVLLAGLFSLLLHWAGAPTPIVIGVPLASAATLVMGWWLVRVTRPWRHRASVKRKGGGR